MNYSFKPISTWIRFMKDKVGFLDIYDIGILKACTVSVGMIIGAFYSKTVRKLAGILALITAIGSAYLFIKVFLKDTVL